VDPKEPKILVSIEHVKYLRVRHGPHVLDRKPGSIGNVVRALVWICASNHQELNALGTEIGEPVLIIGMDPIPPGTREVPGHRFRGCATRVMVIIMHEPMAVSVNVDVSHVVPKTHAHEVIRQIRA
jgi:hypothetical protein